MFIETAGCFVDEISIINTLQVQTYVPFLHEIRFLIVLAYWTSGLRTTAYSPTIKSV